jgi:hypothetical protein
LTAVDEDVCAKRPQPHVAHLLGFTRVPSDLSLRWAIDISVLCLAPTLPVWPEPFIANAGAVQHAHIQHTHFQHVDVQFVHVRLPHVQREPLPAVRAVISALCVALPRASSLVGTTLAAMVGAFGAVFLQSEAVYLHFRHPLRDWCDRGHNDAPREPLVRLQCRCRPER